jgi:hypothetical protein
VKNKKKRDEDWAEAKRRCGLNQEDIRMAKELGMSPRSLIKNIPSKSQQWKAPVKYWIRDLYEKRQRKSARNKSTVASKSTRNEAEPRTITGGPVISSANDGELEANRTAASSDEALWRLLFDSINIKPTEEVMKTLLAEDVDEYSAPSPEEIEQENIMMLRRQKCFRMAAEYVAQEFSQFPWVEQVALFGSVARPLQKEVPRFYRFRRAGIRIWHECKDVDLAVWVSGLGELNALRKAKNRALSELQKDTGGSVSVAHHQVDVFIIEPLTNRYLGRLCNFNECPKGKAECEVKDCGAHPFLQQHEGFRLRREALQSDPITVLFSREPAGEYDDELPF